MAEIRMFAGNFAPRSWAYCDGQTLAISQYTALFSLLGSVFGGDGRSTFALPDFRGRVPVHASSQAGPGLNRYTLGERGGTETVALTTPEIPSHSHLAEVTVTTEILASSATGTADTPGGNYLASPGAGPMYSAAPSRGQTLAGAQSAGTATVEPTGSGQAHSNIQPFIGINYIICLQGIFPSRS